MKLSHNLQPKYVYNLIYFFIFVSILLSAYNFYFLNKILPGVYLNGVNYGGLTYKNALQKMDDTLPKTQKITISLDGKPYDISYTDITLTYNKDATFEKLFKVGRTSYVSQFSYAIGLFTKKTDMPFDVSYTADQLDVELATLSAQVFPKVKNAFYSFEKDELVINDAGAGKIIDLSKLKADILDGLKFGKVTYTANTKNFTPTVYKKDLETHKDKITKYLDDGINLDYRDFTYFPSKETLLRFVEFEKEGNLLVAKVNSLEIENYILDVASKINQDPKSIDFKIKESGEIDSFTPPDNGRDLNVMDTKKQITDLVLNYFNNNSELKNIALNVKEVTPDTNSNKYGITELVAEGISYFEHSIPARVSNIKTASIKISGSLVAPGEFYSFNNSVGPIDVEHGFNSAYVISKGRTILGTGGGVCQVSSTVFRAALNGGFPITERTAHAYRVGYYEQYSKIGYDATIYQPTVDLKFKNDTEHYILVYTELNLDKSRLSVKLYGTKDGRTVEVTDPKLGPQIAPPKAIYEDDPTLPKGQVVQTEYPAWGGSSVFKQIVKNKDGSLKFENTFKSNYQPWPAVFKKGTKD